MKKCSQSIYIYIYIERERDESSYEMRVSYIYIYIIKQLRHLLSTYVCIYPFKLLYRFYDIRRELVNEPYIIK